MMGSRLRIYVIFGFAALGACGCGSGPKTYKVDGVVTLDGKPLAGATVAFMPQAQDGHLARGLTDQDGKFQLSTFGTNDGAVRGEYKVTVIKEEGSGPAPELSPASKTMQSMFMKKTPEGKKDMMEARRKAPSIVPPVYGDATKTPLKETVPPSGTVRLELNSKP